jgi:hypothetical protein
MTNFIDQKHLTMRKLQKLNQDVFKQFEKFQLQDLTSIKGGAPSRTAKDSNKAEHLHDKDTAGDYDGFLG